VTRAPVAVPIAVEAEGAQAHQGHAGLLAPVQALVLLTAGHAQVVGLRGVAAAAVLTLPMALPLAGDGGPAGFQVGDPRVEGGRRGSSGAVACARNSSAVAMAPSPSPRQSRRPMAPIDHSPLLWFHLLARTICPLRLL